MTCRSIAVVLLRILPLLIGISCGACSNAPEPPAPRSGKKAPDRADPKVLVEGPVEAFGIHFPYRTAITSRTPRSIAAELPYPMEAVVNYLRARISPESVDVGPRSTVFHSSTLLNKENSNLLELTIRRAGASSTKVSIIERTPQGVPAPAAAPTAPP